MTVPEHDAIVTVHAGLADILARIVLWPGELAVGIVTAFLGAPVLIAIIRRRKVVGL